MRKPNSTLPPEVTRSFNTENLIKFSDLAPSLQKMFYDLEGATYENFEQSDRRLNSKRVTVDMFPPGNPKNNVDIWIDTRYRCLRVFTEDNWEFTRVAWYGGDKTQILNPPTEDPALTDYKHAGAQTKPHVEYIFATFTITQSSVMIAYKEGVPTTNPAINLNGDVNNIEISYEVSGGSISGTVGYILGVKFKSDKYSGTKVCIPINKNSDKVTIPGAYMDRFMVDVHSASRPKLENIIPLRFAPTGISADKEGVYYPEFPYGYTLGQVNGIIAALGANGSYQPPGVPGSYSPLSGTVTVTVKVIQD